MVLLIIMKQMALNLQIHQAKYTKGNQRRINCEDELIRRCFKRM